MNFSKRRITKSPKKTFDFFITLNNLSNLISISLLLLMERADHSFLLDNHYDEVFHDDFCF